MYYKLTSKDNPRIKQLMRLYKAKERKINNLIIVEGIREIKRCINSKWDIKEYYYSPEIASNQIKEIIKKSNIPVIECTKEIFEKISYQNNPDGLIALSYVKKYSLNDIKIKNNLFLLVAENIEKPGNLGSILRTADGAGINAMILLNKKIDISNPNVIRSSIGSCFSIPIIETNISLLMEWLDINNIEAVATMPNNGKAYTEFNFNKSICIFLGSEKNGLSQKTIKYLKNRIYIPMLGINDSLNVSATAAIVIYEALRQRNLKK